MREEKTSFQDLCLLSLIFNVNLYRRMGSSERDQSLFFAEILVPNQLEGRHCGGVFWKDILSRCSATSKKPIFFKCLNSVLEYTIYYKKTVKYDIDSLTS